MRVAVATVGCKLNQYESEYVLESFLKEGFILVDFKDFADVYVVNTCTVTSQADSKSRQLIRQAKRRNPNSLVVAIGCYAELRREELESIGADIVFGNVEKPFVAELVKRYLESGVLKGTSEFKSCEFVPMPIEDFKDYSRAFVKVQDGCNSRCSYCVVWKARGASRSASVDYVVDEVRRLVDKGFEEVVLTGVDLGSYGWDRGYDLVSLLEELVKIEALKKIRLSSIEPTRWTPRLIDFLSHEKIAKHFHIPLQSASDRILKLMERDYTSIEFEKLILKLVDKVPEAGIGVDVIVGFPTETQEDFLATYNLLKSLPIYYMHIFSYSDRPGTPASVLKPKVRPDVKKERWNMLKELKDKKMESFVSSFIGKNLYGVVEGRLTKDGLYTRALSENYISLLIPGDCRLERCKVRPFKIVGKQGLNLIANPL